MVRRSSVEQFYSPNGIYQFIDHALHHYVHHSLAIPSDVDKMMVESALTALFAYDLALQSGVATWLRPVDPKEQAPDVEVVQFVRRNGLFVRDELLVEVVAYTEHSDETLTEFLKRTKLDGKRRYPANTIILAHLDRPMTRDDLLDAAGELSVLSGFPPVYAIRCIDGDLHQTLWIYPNLSEIRNVRVSEMMQSGQDLVVDTNRGMGGDLGRSPNPIPTSNPFIIP